MTKEFPTAAGARLPLQGADNVRDIGGYPTGDGRHVRRGLVFRADALHRLTDSDHHLLAKLGLAVVCDFRAGTERRACAGWKTPQPEFFPLPISPGVDTLQVFAQIRLAPTPETSRNAMLELYRSMPVENAPQYRTLLGRILAGHLPALYHCSAGKDRTGLFTAFLLTALGVPYETVMRDYLLSGEYLQQSETARHLTAMMQGYLQLDGAADAVVQPFIDVEPSFLDTAFETIRASYGSFDAYRERELGLTDGDVETLQRRLLR